ncbi:MAG TPA: FAD-binding oxidoreductase [Ginsengibacter sp.]|nr:FAD-binding oxidoreductase [Ginsengibacter sp.]
MIFDCIIIGKGLIGSAAARYLSYSQKKVAVIGPGEHSNPGEAVVFSSHYDEARIQRIIGTDSTWTKLNLQSSAEYKFIEKESGIMFHCGVGCLYVNPHGSDHYIDQVEKHANQFNLAYKLFENGEAICKAFGDLNVPMKSKGIFESSPSGYINPRQLIKAQLNLFQKNNGAVINEIANEITYEKNYVRVTTLEGNIYHATKVLLSPGAFINFFNLTKNKLALTLKSETTLLAQVTAEEAKRLSTFPSLLYEIDIPGYKNIYLVQPVLYPDGNYYLKMGCNLPGDIYFDNIEDIQQWFRNGTSDESLGILKDALLNIIPGLHAQEYFTKRCIVTFTKHRKPYIGALNDHGLFVACGGNGYGAMCSDALGSIAANLLSEGSFPEDYLPESFAPVFSEILL